MNSSQKATRTDRYDDPPTMPTLIHRIIRPQSDTTTLLENYFRSNHPAGILIFENGIQFRRGVIVSTDTIFNAFNVADRKEATGVGDLSLVLRGSGKFVVRTGLHQLSDATRLLGETTVGLEDGGVTVLPVGEWNSLVAGVLFFSLEALEDGVLTEAFYESSTPPVGEIKPTATGHGFLPCGTCSWLRRNACCLRWPDRTGFSLRRWSPLKCGKRNPGWRVPCTGGAPQTPP